MQIKSESNSVFCVTKFGNSLGDQYKKQAAREFFHRIFETKKKMNIFTALFGIVLVAAQHWSYGWHPGTKKFLQHFYSNFSGKRSPNYEVVPDYYYGPAKLGCPLN